MLCAQFYFISSFVFFYMTRLCYGKLYRVLLFHLETTASSIYVLYILCFVLLHIYWCQGAHMTNKASIFLQSGICLPAPKSSFNLAENIKDLLLLLHLFFWSLPRSKHPYLFQCTRWKNAIECESLTNSMIFLFCGYKRCIKYSGEYVNPSCKVPLNNKKNREP